MSKLIKKPHQRRAVEDIIRGDRGIINADRAMFISACATGKTLTGLWTVEEYLFNYVHSEHKIAVFFFPSLALISQTYNAFFSQTSIKDYNPLVVCSETKIGQTAEDPEETPDDSIVYETCTDIENTKAYLSDLSIKTKVVFVTYHSASIVGSALLALGLEADIGSFDEAHRTAQQGDTQNMSFALLDENFPIRKRLFMTATPKHIASSDEDEKAEFSMDNESFYGCIAHELPMRQAINEGLICDYSIIAGAMESNEEIDDENVISVIAEAFIRGIKKTGVKTAIAFQKNITTSKAFAQWVATHYPDIQIRHIDGTMSHNERESVMQFLREGENIRIVTNSKILSEGVDAPSVDMVGFLSNIASEIDIVQRVGRVQRLLAGFPDKIGYVFVPIITNSKKEIIYGKESLFSLVANLRENDEQLRAETVAYASGGKNNKSVEVVNLDEVASGGATVDVFALPMIQKKINAILLGGASRREWEEIFLEAKKFYDENGRMPNIKTEYALWKWIADQRGKNNAGSLDIHRRNAMIAAFGESVFAVQTELKWEENFIQLKEMYSANGNIMPFFSSDNPLTSWVSLIRTNYKNKTLDPDKEALLFDAFGDEIFIREVSLRKRWFLRLEEVRVFVEQNNKIPTASKKAPDTERKLGMWMTDQRRAYRAGALDEEQASLLNVLDGTSFDNIDQDAEWGKKLDLAHCLYLQEGNLPTHKTEEGRWLQSMRKKSTKGELSERQKDMLIEKFGKAFFLSRKQVLEKEWNDNFEKIKQYYQINKTFPSSTSKVTDEANLGKWRVTQKSFNRDKRLNKSRHEALVRCFGEAFFGDKDEAYNADWKEKHKNAVEFCEKNNRAPSISSKDDDEVYIAKWISAQKGRIKKGFLSEEQRELFGSIPFLPKSREELNREYFNIMFSEMEVFIKENGHYPSVDENARLEQWRRNTRRLIQENKCTEDIKQRVSATFGESFLKAGMDATLDKARMFVEFVVQYGRPPKQSISPLNDDEPGLAKWWGTFKGAHSKGFENKAITNLIVDGIGAERFEEFTKIEKRLAKKYESKKQ